MQKALLLISSGIDSPVAGYLLKDKIELTAIHFDNFSFEDKKTIEKTKRLCKKIGIKTLFLADFAPIQNTNVKNCNRRFQCVLCKRMMLRISEKIAKKHDIKLLVTGENLGQVASQTLDNMIANDNSVSLPILRPLLCAEKNETMATARKIGTYDISTEKSPGCPFVPNSPLTKASIEKVKIEEEKIEKEKLIEDTVKKIKIEKI